MREIFANRLKGKQKELGLTQVEMAKLLNIAPGTLGAYMRQEKIPTIEKALDIAKSLEVSLGWLCGEDSLNTDSYQLNSHSSYADLLRVINALQSLPLVENFKVHTTEIEQHVCDGEICSSSMGISIETADPILVKFYSNYERIRYALGSDDAGKKLIDDWLHLKMAELENKSLDCLPF